MSARALTCRTMPSVIAATAKRSVGVHVPGRPAQRLRKPSEKPPTTLMTASEPLRKVESITAGRATGSRTFGTSSMIAAPGASVATENRLPFSVGRASLVYRFAERRVRASAAITGPQPRSIMRWRRLGRGAGCGAAFGLLHAVDQSFDPPGERIDLLPLVRHGLVQV